MTSVKKRRCDGGSETSAVIHTLSTAQVQDLISREVQSALEQSDKMMKALMARIQKVDDEPRYDASLRKLEAHIRKVKRRGDAVFADLRKQGSLDTFRDQNLTSTEKETQTRTSFANVGISSSSSTSGVCRQNGNKHTDSPQTSTQDNMDSRSTPEGCEIPAPVGTEEKAPKQTQEAEESLLSGLPPFPHTPFPEQLPAAAACKSMPQKPVVKVARIKNPQGIALLWNVEEDDPDAAAMDCYYIYVAQRRDDGSFSKWKTMGVIKAMPLPMACRVAAERSGDKTLCFIVIGKDVFGRYGPYSDVHTVWAVDT